MTATTMTDHQGLVGLARTAATGARGIKFNPLNWIIRLVALAAMILIAKKAGFSFTYDNAAVIAGLGVAALLGEFYFSGEMTRAWHERATGALAMFAVLWACAFGYSVNQWLGAASDGQFEKAGVQKAAFIRTQDSASTERELAKEVDRLEEKLKLAPQRTPEAAQAAIDNAKAHKFWKSTDGCKETKGPQTREFCSAYASAVADKSLATEALVLREEHKIKSAELRKVRAERKGAPVAVSEDRSDLRIYTKHLGMTQEAAMDLQAAGTILFISLVMSGLGILTENQQHRGQPKRPWGFWKALQRVSYRIRRAIWGGAATPPDVVNNTTHIHGMQYHQMLAR